MASVPFRRDRFTWLMYLALACFSFLQAGLGPMMAFLRPELDLNYTETGAHFSAFALGIILAGLGAGVLIGRIGRRAVFWMGGSGMILAALLFALGRSPLMTIPAAWMIGGLGTLILVVVQSALSDYHGEGRALPLMEANIAASISATGVPFLLGAFQSAGVGWRGAIFVAVLGWGALVLIFWRVLIPDSAPLPAESDATATATTTGTRRRLPRLFWLYWVLLFVGVSSEWCVAYWGADYLSSEVGFGRATAAAIFSLYFLANVIGRIVASRLTRHYDPPRLLLAAALTGLTGFLLFWLAPLPAISAAGLFVAGLGIANFFPLGLAGAAGAAGAGQSDAASGRVTLAAGLAIFTLPQIMGALADAVGIQAAYGVVPVLLVGVGVLAWGIGRR